MTASPSPSPTALEVPGYDVIERIGAGGFGEVFRARHRVIGRDVAIKVIHDRHRANPTVIARFVAEARAVNKISHPNIVQISDFGELADGRPYCVMELLAGQTMRAILEERKRLELAEALPILRGIADAIDAAHGVGIVHRDLKPDNVFVLADGSIKLIDFGLAKLMTEEVSVTQTGHVFGTPLYMSPEQCRGRDITPASDAYSFGALAYHMLVGEPPFSGEPLDLAVQHINEPPRPPSTRCAEVPARVDAPLLALLEKDPALRPTRMSAVVDALAGTRALPPVRRSRRRLVIAGVAATAVAGASIGVMTRHSPRRVEVWSQRTLRLDFDGIVSSPHVTREGMVFYGDNAGWWRHDTATAQTTRLPIGDARGVVNVEELPDGVLLVSREKPRVTDLVDPRDHSQTRLFDAGFASQSPDGRLIAGWDDNNTLVVHDRTTHQTRRLFHLDDMVVESPPVWSPDGSQLLFGRQGRPSPSRPLVFVTDVGDGTTRPVVGAFEPRVRSETTEDYYSSIAFLADGRIAYCTNSPARVVTRPLWGIFPTTIAQLDESVSECILTSRGHRLVVTPGHSQATVAMLDLSQSALLPRQIAGPLRMLPVAADDHRVFGYAYDAGGRSLRSVDVESGAIATERACTDEMFFVRRGTELLHYTVDSTTSTVRLLARDTCAVVAEWKLPPFVHVGVPDCSATWCTVATTHADHSSVWKLVPGEPPKERARLPSEAAGADPLLAVSLDGSQIAVAMKGARSSLHVLDGDDGPPRQIPVRAALLDGVAWGADGELLVAGQGIDQAPYALVSIGRDGTQRTLWSSKTTYLVTLLTDPSHRRLFGRVATWRQEFVVLDQGDK